MPAMHVSIAGRVQGVGFRWFTRVMGRRLDLKGWVRNCPDGTVEVAASGPADTLRAFREALSRGPDGAFVEQLRDLDELYDDFDYPFAMRR